MRIIIAPERVNMFDIEPAIFLAGSIEKGKADNWQERVKGMFSPMEDVALFNPRRPVWTGLDEKELNVQIDWELEHIEKCDVILFYFDPNTISPVSLIELGLCIKRNTRTYVVCPEGYHVRANVIRTCQRYNIQMFDTLEKAVIEIKEFLFI